MKIIDKIMGFFGYVRCRVCNKWTEPSISEGSLCSVKCLIKEIDENIKRDNK